MSEPISLEQLAELNALADRLAAEYDNDQAAALAEAKRRLGLEDMPVDEF